MSMALCSSGMKVPIAQARPWLSGLPFSDKTKYFEPSTKEFMINYRVENLRSTYCGIKEWRSNHSRRDGNLWLRKIRTYSGSRGQQSGVVGAHRVRDFQFLPRFYRCQEIFTERRANGDLSNRRFVCGFFQWMKCCQFALQKNYGRVQIRLVAGDSR